MIGLNERSKQVRRDVIVLSKANGGYHYAGSFSCVEILLALYDHVLKPEDKFILSKGHACWPLYVLLRERGLDPKLEGHPYRDERNGVHYTTGSLGHGLPGALGMAFARKLQKKPGRIFVLVSDGECQEGTAWESMLIAAHRNVNNLVVIADWNGIQGSGFVRDILPVNGFANVAATLGWKTTIVDGHDVGELTRTLSMEMPKPWLVVANTVKGKGVSFMENVPKWHAKWPNAEEGALMMKELT